METNVPYSSIDEFSYSVWKNGERKKLQCIWGRALAEGEFASGEMCFSFKAAMGMSVADGDESAMVALFCESV
jgi:hypothetical protein